MISCLHTAQVHVATFTDLIPHARHVVREDFLSDARAYGVSFVQDDVQDLLVQLAQDGPVLCTCSTLGPLVDTLGLDHVVRIDRPAMEAAVTAAQVVTVAICLESTRDATLQLFDAVSAGRARADLVLCAQAWPLFEAGDMDGFARAIADAVQGAEVVLLAQASMAVAAPLVAAQGAQVFTTPERAASEVLALEH